MLTNLLNYKTLLLIKTIKMKTFRIEEKFTGYAEVTIEAETEEEALSLYNRGHYPDSDYVMAVSYTHLTLPTKRIV